MSDDDMYGLDHLDAATDARLGKDAVDRYIADCVKAGRPAGKVHKVNVDAVEVVIEDGSNRVLARYPWIYDPLVGMARLK